MKQLIKVAQEITKKGDDFIQKHGPLEFHSVAHDLLISASLHDIYNFEDLVKASFAENFNSQQNYSSFQFSDLPVTISSGEHCFLDLYFWRRRPTVIHDHHFTGAFQCLVGSNIDLEFEFVKAKTLGKYHDLGELKLMNSRQIKKGDVAAIDLLGNFIHQTHHHADLTVNACFRTPDIGEIHLSNYLYSGLRFEKNPEVLDRVNRLMSFINLGEFNLHDLNLTLDDALHFLIRSYRSESQSRKFLELKQMLENRLMAELGLDVAKLLDQHETKMDEIEDLYD